MVIGLLSRQAHNENIFEDTRVILLHEVTYFTSQEGDELFLAMSWSWRANIAWHDTFM